jgi:hypothetical protein
MKKNLLLFIFIFIIQFVFCQQIDVVYNTTTFQTNSLHIAQNHVRQILLSNPTLENNIYVNISPGTYILTTPLQFTAADSGKSGFRVIYKGTDPNNKPIISGGYQVTNWELHDPEKNIYKANIGNQYSRQIYVNGERAIRAKSEANFQFYETKTGYVASCTDFSSWNNINEMEVVSNIRWRHCRIPIESACKGNLIINQNYWNYIHAANGGLEFNRYPPVRIENHLNLLDNENEWFIDRTNPQQHVLYYKPPQSQAIAGLNIIVPSLDQFINGNEVKNLTFENLEFKYNNWNKPSETNPNINNNKFGFWPFFADRIHIINDDSNYNTPTEDEIPGAVSFEYSKNIKILNCNFNNLGSTALTFLIGSQDNVIMGNKFENIAASGIRIGDYSNAPNPCLNPQQYSQSNANCSHTPVTCGEPYLTENQVKLVKNHIVCRNVFDNNANEYLSSCPILVSFARDSKISHNTLTNFTYIGISVGWGFSKGIYHGENQINNNYIDCSKQTIPDGGGIYTLSRQGKIENGNEFRTSIRNNYILNQKFYRAAIYLDHSSSFMDVQNNFIDKSVNHSIITVYECVDEKVKFADCWFNSQNVTIKENYYNENYSDLLPLPINGTYMVVCHDQPCIGNLQNVEYNSYYPNCSNILVKDNYPINSPNNNAINIKNNAGINAPNFQCPTN